VLATTLGVFVIKALHDSIRAKHATQLERSVDIVGRVSALVIGAFAVAMILSGVELWRGLSAANSALNGALR